MTRIMKDLNIVHTTFSNLYYPFFPGRVNSIQLVEMSTKKDTFLSK